MIIFFVGCLLVNFIKIFKGIVRYIWNFTLSWQAMLAQIFIQLILLKCSIILILIDCIVCISMIILFIKKLKQMLEPLETWFILIFLLLILHLYFDSKIRHILVQGFHSLILLNFQRYIFLLVFVNLLLLLKKYITR